MSEPERAYPGELWIVNGGRYGVYRVVRRRDGREIGHAVAWREAVLMAARAVSPELADIALYWIHSDPGECAVLVRGLHVFVSGLVVWEGRREQYAVESERSPGCYYAVQRNRGSGLWNCSCPEFELSGCHDIMFTVWGRSQLVCKHILGVWFTYLYRGAEEGSGYGMATA